MDDGVWVMEKKGKVVCWRRIAPGMACSDQDRRSQKGKWNGGKNLTAGDRADMDCFISPLLLSYGFYREGEGKWVLLDAPVAIWLVDASK